jgi:3-hydroxyacyl-CoA dehydrogenase
MVEEGVASPEDIDNAMVLGYKHPVGPLKTTDIVGLDVRLGIAEYLHQTIGDRFARRRSSATRSPPARSVASPARASTTGRERAIDR